MLRELPLKKQHCTIHSGLTRLGAHSSATVQTANIVAWGDLARSQKSAFFKTVTKQSTTHALLLSPLVSMRFGPRSLGPRRLYAGAEQKTVPHDTAQCLLG